MRLHSDPVTRAMHTSCFCPGFLALSVAVTVTSLESSATFAPIYAWIGCLSALLFGLGTFVIAPLVSRTGFYGPALATGYAAALSFGAQAYLTPSRPSLLWLGGILALLAAADAALAYAAHDNDGGAGSGRRADEATAPPTDLPMSP